jgi:hypothetical protein
LSSVIIPLLYAIFYLNFQIPVGAYEDNNDDDDDDEHRELVSSSPVAGAASVIAPDESSLLSNDGNRRRSHASAPREPRRACLARLWKGFDLNYMKPALTTATPALTETLPKYCLPLARCFTSKEQMGEGEGGVRRTEDGSLTNGD